MRQPLAVNSQRKIPLAQSFISAGPAVEIGDDYALLDVNEHITRGREGFVAFVVTGDSMVDHIHPDNLVFVDTNVEARNGDIVAADVNGLTCIKIFRHSMRGLYLVSKNADYQPRQITAKDSFHILGVVRGHLAMYPG